MAETRVPRGIKFAEVRDGTSRSPANQLWTRIGLAAQLERSGSGSSDDIDSEIRVVMPSSFLCLITMTVRKSSVTGTDTKLAWSLTRYDEHVSTTILII